MAVHIAEPGSESTPRTVPGSPASRMPAGSGDVQWQVSRFLEATKGVRHAFVLSPAGNLLASSGALDRKQADQLAAMVFDLCVLTQGLDTVCGAGRPRQTVVDLRNGVLCLVAVADGSLLAMLADSDGDRQHVAHKATRLAARIGTLLVPEARAELRAHRPS
ncbi:roadblock/LC7 domain-containing protein [Streptomyces sp. NPDC050658]|uniref:roadblock/LC7 domain-containing protein n=1 Tax=unclassified Streptomyces TaxID=2593676 RepID=UPI003434454A